MGIGKLVVDDMSCFTTLGSLGPQAARQNLASVDSPNVTLCHSYCRETQRFKETAKVDRIPNGKQHGKWRVYPTFLAVHTHTRLFESDRIFFYGDVLVRGYSDVRKEDRWATWIAPAAFVHGARIELSFDGKSDAIPSMRYLVWRLRCMKPSHHLGSHYPAKS